MKRRFFLLFLSFGFFTACKPASAALPVEDINAVRTQAVQTAVMEMTVQAVLHPSASPVPVIGNEIPALSIEPAAATIATESSGSAAGSSQEASGETILSETTDLYGCDQISKTPLDELQKAGANYDMVWTVRNTGIATWNARGYKVKWLGGSDVSINHQYALSKNVAPSETIEIVVPIQLPANPTDNMLVTRWGILNENGDIICKFYHAVPYTY